MGRETDDEREVRLKRAGDWLLGEMKKRGWSQRYLGDQLGVSQQQISAYVRGWHQFDSGLVPDLARLLEMEEEDVWRKMLPLPRAFRTDEETVAWARARLPEVMEQLPDAVEQISGGKAPEPRTEAPAKPTRVTRKSDKPPLSSQGRESAV